jgi:hypothetical protein
MDPAEWNGERLWVVALYPPFQYEQDGEKYGSLKREIIKEIPNWLP